MTTYLEARAALVAAIGASERHVDPPYASVWAGGSELRATGAGDIRFRFRVVCVGPVWADDADASRTLATFVAGILVDLFALKAWAVDSLGPDVTRSIAGGLYLTADIGVTYPATLS